MIKKIQFLFLSFILSFGASLYSQETIRILALGNSFSVDAIEENLHELGEAAGKTIIVGNLFIGGSSLTTHWTNASGNIPAYSYRKIIETGEKITTEKTTLLSAINDEKWDYISFQQSSGNSGRYDTYFPYFTDIVNYVKANNEYSGTTYTHHHTWAYPANSTTASFASYYKSNQLVMFNAILDAVYRATEQVGIEFIIPVGTAIQNARTSFIGDNLNRDGHHLNYLGQYIAACTWFEKLTNISVVDNNYVPITITKEEAKAAQLAAHNAVLAPKVITQINVTPPSNTRFKISADNTNLILWLNSDKSIDMTKDAQLMDVKTIGEKAFTRTAAQSIILSNTMREIHPQAFWYAPDLYEIIAPENNNYFKSFNGILYSKDEKLLHTFPNGKPKKDDNSEVINLLEGIEEIGSNSFREVRITKVVLPNSVRSIASSAFQNVQRLQELEMGSNIENIGLYAFYNCIGLTKIRISNPNPPIFEDTEKGAFGRPDIAATDRSFYENCTLYVPVGSKVRYSNPSIGGLWSKFKNIEEFTPSGLSKVENIKDVFSYSKHQGKISITNLTSMKQLVQLYSLNGELSHNLVLQGNTTAELTLSNGLYFAKVGNDVKKIFMNYTMQ